MSQSAVHFFDHAPRPEKCQPASRPSLVSIETKPGPAHHHGRLSPVRRIKRHPAVSKRRHAPRPPGGCRGRRVQPRWQDPRDRGRSRLESSSGIRLPGKNSLRWRCGTSPSRLRIPPGAIGWRWVAGKKPCGCLRFANDACRRVWGSSQRWRTRYVSRRDGSRSGGPLPKQTTFGFKYTRVWIDRRFWAASKEKNDGGSRRPTTFLSGTRQRAQKS